MRQSLPSRYQLNKNSDGIYYFATSTGILYFCRFADKTSSLSPLLGIYDIQVLEFEFFPYKPDGVETQGHDPQIATTIAALLLEVLSNPNVAIIYLCDASDGKQKSRQHLFARWYHKHMSGDAIRMPLEIEIVDEDNRPLQSVFGCTLIGTTFPHLPVLEKELIHEAAEIITAKYF